jgi:hypothetical protein
MLPLLLTALFSPSGFADAATQAQYEAVRALGEMNGIALQCRYIDQVRRLKAAVVLHAPKERSFGLAFEESTSESFMAFMRDDGACPPAARFARDVGHRIDDLAAVFR